MKTFPLFIPYGYVAVVSAIILSAVLTALVLVESTSTFWSRYDQLDQEHHTQSILAADSCVYEGLLQYTEDPTSLQPYERVADGNCTIDSATVENGVITISVHSYAAGTYVRTVVQATQSLSTGILSITSWRDITSIPP